MDDLWPRSGQSASVRQIQGWCLIPWENGLALSVKTQVKGFGVITTAYHLVEANVIVTSVHYPE
jgi:hypothetical protein